MTIRREGLPDETDQGPRLQGIIGASGVTEKAQGTFCPLFSALFFIVILQTLPQNPAQGTAGKEGRARTPKAPGGTSRRVFVIFCSFVIRAEWISFGPYRLSAE